MSEESKDSLTNVPNNKDQKHILEYFNDPDFETKDINEVTSLLLDSYRTYNGRRYMNYEDINCIFPSDKIELERSTLSHLLNKYQWKGNFRSPIKDKLNVGGTTILDIGCGSGLWVTDMGLEYPSSLIVGIDIESSNFPSSDQYPPNVCFLTCNAIHGIPFPQNTFDFVHMSMMWGAFSEDQWIIVIKDLVRVLKHDGWIEFTEPDTAPRNVGKIQQLLTEAFSNASRDIRGVNLNIYKMLPKYIEAIDELEDLNCMTVDYPVGEWSGCFGKYSLENLKRIYQSVTFLPKYMRISNEEFNNLLNDYVKEANKSKASFGIFKCFAKKVSEKV
ncbi:S-adenosyl-L-methionine-dependent methyltransferase [Gigaspora margarita]|uniref:S-adenosyl-L-methionine-dependent methyltransferase n=1 Tax=Gigaspora margarita TaxID=4874 RepID=A0A8H4AIA3_GIGMA|nr:S-adenosyl-L-methionine-dependent methyltransferase [Gigaspora margarita]